MSASPMHTQEWYAAYESGFEAGRRSAFEEVIELLNRGAHREPESSLPSPIDVEPPL